ncbi:13078_t:CDS:2 [Ambispora gerdemannii]|uniref:13078_t:CDS:1 n=1 Tax=Ambispora gerdemannii TaxID=144530 RepID=A0A9N8ZS78_9GLOM|nr:13078_t:CDS:2 [Ambispora gerdemannii]
MSSAQEFFTKANDAFFADDFDEAVDLYNRAIELDATNAEYLLKRSAALVKLNKNKEALADAEKALHVSEESQNQASIAKAFLHKGRVKDYHIAKKSFDHSKELNPNERLLVTWIEKVDAELAKTATPPMAVNSTPQNFLSQSRVRHEWYQNENYVTISIFIKNVKKEAVKVEIEKRLISVSVQLPISGSDYSLELDPLAHEIIPSESKYEVLSTKIEIKLKKAQGGVKWGVLEGEDSLTGTISSGDGKLTYPSSARKAKNWDELEREISKEKEKPEGEEALNVLFQQIYGNADDDTRKAMLKSYTESSGTCLSTNWSEVKKGKVETKAPDGMVAKKWGA